ncbi:hypothetical protein NLJ89_g8029 [Agrocybe chaxingu]|uniref:RING-type domain-containing protein n=1 Tax=Agrocybe chaxingu TaxID=84603 RepID=A0A9W8JVI7_9AGAR|nr:hypothetical protein NLJ89_g8029 [Agrocybe chaxingu]
MSSDYEFSDGEEAYSDDEEMIDGTQDEEGGTDDSQDEMEMDNFGDDFKVVPKGKRKPYEVEYESLSQQAVERLMQRDVDHICGIFGVDASVASLLLRYLKWNKERLIEKYMDNATAVLVAAGVTVPEAIPQAAKPSSRRPTTRGLTKPTKSSKSPTLAYTTPKALQRTTSRKPDEPFVCQICFNDAPDMQTLALDCEHTFCSDCWTDYVVSKIKDESEHAIRPGCASR